MTDNQSGDSSVVRTLFEHNTWANLKLLDFCEGLIDEQLDTAAVGGYGTIRATLWHFVRAEVGYVNQVNDRLPGVPLPRDAFPGFQVLRDAARWAGDELLQLALATRADTINRTSPPRDPIEYPLAALMVQAVTHSCEHRTQVAAIITHLGLEPPDMSGWGYMEATGSLREL